MPILDQSYNSKKGPCPRRCVRRTVSGVPFIIAVILTECASSIPAFSASSPASFVQQAASSAHGSPSSLTLSFSANTLAGDLLLVAFDYNNGATPSAVTDSQGNTFTSARTPLTTPGGSVSSVYYAKNVKGGADTVMVTLSAASNYLEVYLSEYSGINPTNPIDAQAGASGTAGAASSGAATTTVAGDIIYGFCDADWACTAGSGFTARSTLKSNLVEDMVAGGPGQYAATGTANGGWSMLMLALKPESGAVPSPTIFSPTTAGGSVGTPFSYQIRATNGPTAFGATGLPQGLSVNNATGLISGTPASAATSTVTLSATNASGTGTATLTLTISASTRASFVQQAASSAHANPDSLTLSFSANTLAGDLLLVAFDYNNGATPSAVTDSQGNTFTSARTPLTTPGGSVSSVYYAKNVKGGADTVMVTLSAASNYLEVYLSEYSGINPTNPIDAQAGASGTAGAASSGAATTTVAGDIIYGFCDADWACTAGSGFTARSTLKSNLVEDMVAGGPGQYAATGTANSGWSMLMLALKPNSAPLGGPEQNPSAAVSLSTTSLTFGNLPVDLTSTAQTITVTNTGSVALSITGIGLTGADPTDFSEATTCGASLATGASCTVVVLFRPLTSGNLSASLTVTDNAPGSPQSVSLSGGGSHDVVLTWTASATPGILGYYVYRGTASGKESTTPLNSTPIAGTFYADSNVTDGQTYYYVLTALGANGTTHSVLSSEASATAQ